MRWCAELMPVETGFKEGILGQTCEERAMLMFTFCFIIFLPIHLRCGEPVQNSVGMCLGHTNAFS